MRVKNITLTYYNKKGKIIRHRSSAERLKLIASLRTCMNILGVCRVRIHASYGKHEDVFGNIEEFTNDGSYENLKDANRALLAFLET